VKHALCESPARCFTWNICADAVVCAKAVFWMFHVKHTVCGVAAKCFTWNGYIANARITAKRPQRYSTHLREDAVTADFSLRPDWTARSAFELPMTTRRRCRALAAGLQSMNAVASPAKKSDAWMHRDEGSPPRINYEA
jgi:hypothetical protein